MVQIKARVILAVLAFFLFLVVQMNRVNLNIAIIVMEDSYFGNDWDAKVIVLGAYYWCYSLIELPGTFIVKKYGCRKILAISLFICGLGNFVFPIGYQSHPIYGIIIRAAQGLLLGISWPAVAVLSAKWIPRQERSKFMSTYQGTSIGTSVTNAIGGIIIYDMGWQYIFHLTGIVSISWVVFWLFYGYDSPAEHPRISKEEREYIQKYIVENNNSNKQAVPWKEIFTSKAFWGVFFGAIGIMWFMITIAMQLPPYLHDVHQVDIKTNGLLLCIPDIFNYLFSLGFSVFTDKQIKNETVTITTARKVAVVFSHIVPAIILIILGTYAFESLTLAMILSVIAVATGGATSSGIIANIVDISPNNAGTIMGICKSVCFIPGVLSPIIVKYFTADNPHNWIPVFSITSVILVVSAIFYFILGSGEVQKWNSQVTKDVEISNIENETIMKEGELFKLDKEIDNDVETKNLMK